MPRTSSNRRNPPNPNRRRGATASQLRTDIDRGRTNDKVNFGDPAAVPLGTDDEAAGTPLPPELLGQERWRELHRTPSRPAAAPPRREPYVGRRILIAIALIAIAVALGLWLGR